MDSRFVNVLRGDVFRDPWKLHEYSSLANNIASHVEGRPASVVDIGCGDGLFSSCLARALGDPRVIGIDLSPDPNWPRRHGRVLFMAADAARPPCLPGSIDMVIAKDLLHHVDDPIMAAKTVIQLTSNRVIFIEANAQNPVMNFYARENGDQHFDRKQLMTILQAAAPGIHWSAAEAIAYPFYLPPTTDKSALWVWPITGVMLLSFKIARSSAVARTLSRTLRKRPWPAPYWVMSCQLSNSGE